LLEDVIPQINSYLDKEQFQEAYDLIVEAQQDAPLDAKLNELLMAVSQEINIQSFPPGAEVYRRDPNPDSPWSRVGQTPLKEHRVAKGESMWKLEKDGYAPAERLNSLALGSNWFWEEDTIKLIPGDQVPDDMIYIPASNMPLRIPGLTGVEDRRVPGFFIDRTEVSNEDYRQFILDGGYRKKEFWEFPFEKEGRTVSWEEAMEIFVDRSGRPGPSGWSVGDFPEGQENHPVDGISWYEAQAYGTYSGKKLPTIFHFSVAATVDEAHNILPYSNFENVGTWPVNRAPGIGGFGTYNLAGNVREWQHTLTKDTRLGFCLGGAWGEPFFASRDALAKDLFDRSPGNGFRCIQYWEDLDDQDILESPVQAVASRSLTSFPATDAVFESYRRQFDYDATPLDPEVQHDIVDSQDFTCEKVTINAAYGNERFDIYCYLPKHVTAPYQPVVIYPGAGALHNQKFNPRNIFFVPADFIVKSGRAVIFPVYKSTFERQDGVPDGFPRESNFYKDHMIMWVKDFRRTVDYLELRDDMDVDRLAFCGISWGGITSGIIPAVEPRIDVVISIVGGLTLQASLPEVDQLHYLPRIEQPFLMLNGKYDFIFPIEQSQKPMFTLLGTPNEHKKHVLAESNHLFPREELIRETLDWLDEYLGKVDFNVR
jgi:dienelactone hydrolase